MHTWSSRNKYNCPLVYKFGPVFPEDPLCFRPLSCFAMIGKFPRNLTSLRCSAPSSAQGWAVVRTNAQLTNVFYILVPRGRAPFGQHQESRPLGWSNTGRPRFTNFRQIWQIWLAENTKRILCTCSENRVGTEVAIPVADQKERGFWGRECAF